MRPLLWGTGFPHPRHRPEGRRRILRKGKLNLFGYGGQLELEDRAFVVSVVARYGDLCLDGEGLHKGLGRVVVHNELVAVGEPVIQYRSAVFASDRCDRPRSVQVVGIADRSPVHDTDPLVRYHAAFRCREQLVVFEVIQLGIVVEVDLLAYVGRNLDRNILCYGRDGGDRLLDRYLEVANLDLAAVCIVQRRGDGDVVCRVGAVPVQRLAVRDD